MPPCRPRQQRVGKSPKPTRAEPAQTGTGSSDDSIAPYYHAVNVGLRPTQPDLRGGVLILWDWADALIHPNPSRSAELHGGQAGARAAKAQNPSGATGASRIEIRDLSVVQNTTLAYTQHSTASLFGDYLIRRLSMPGGAGQGVR